MNQDNTVKKSDHEASGVIDIVEVADIEEYAKRGETPPHAKAYVIRIDREKFTVDQPSMIARDLLILAGKQPPENFTLWEKLKGGRRVKLDLAQVVNFTAPGVEHFNTMPRDQTEG